jgi:translation elongation factor EF-Ts
MSITVSAQDVKSLRERTGAGAPRERRTFDPDEES